MSTVLFGLYSSRAATGPAVAALQSAGFGEAHVQVVSREAGSTPFEVAADTFRASDLWTGYGASPDESRFYADGVEAGGTLVVVLAAEGDVDRAAALLSEHGPVPYPG